MGNCNSCTKLDLNQLNNKKAYDFSHALGQGGFGKVWKVTHKKNKKTHAMKIMQKNKILTKKSVASVINEKNILADIQSEFIINMVLAFQDIENLYLILEYVDGGDMRYHLNKGVEYTEEETKFIACSIILGLEEIHQKNVIHRDLKPENLVFQADGNLKITDFGIARYFRPNNSDQTSGTPGYMAPEVLLKQAHNFTVDFYGLGVILFEIVYGERPYLGRTRQEIKMKVLEQQRRLTQLDMPDETWTMECAHFINQLIQRKPTARLGFNGIKEIKQHPWVKNFPWEQLKNKTLQPPWIPIIYPGDAGGSFVNQDQSTQEDERDKQNLILLKQNSVQEQFLNFNHDPLGIIHQKDVNIKQQKQMETLNLTTFQTNLNNSRVETNTKDNTFYPLKTNNLLQIQNTNSQFLVSSANNSQTIIKTQQNSSNIIIQQQQQNKSQNFNNNNILQQNQKQIQNEQENQQLEEDDHELQQQQLLLNQQKLFLNNNESIQKLSLIDNNDQQVEQQQQTQLKQYYQYQNQQQQQNITEIKEAEKQLEQDSSYVTNKNQNQRSVRQSKASQASKIYEQSIQRELSEESINDDSQQLIINPPIKRQISKKQKLENKQSQQK